MLFFVFGYDKASVIKLENMSLTKQLAALAEASSQKIPAEIQQTMQQAIADLSNSNLLKKAIKTGDRIPDIKLPNAQGKEVALWDNLREDKKLVIAFYRGGWCPYCNLELKALQAILPEINKAGAELIAITPETPDNSLTTKEKNSLGFEILTDKDNAVANSLNLAYQIPAELDAIYKGFGIDLGKSQGNQNRTLPIAATFVVNTDGVITYHFLEEDYKLRADTDAILEALHQ